MMKSGDSGNRRRRKKWNAIGSIVTGATHLRRDRPCQDALHFEKFKGFAVACVADGHGSDACPYSGEGAELAVTLAAELLGGVLKQNAPFPTLSANKDIWLPKQIEAKWKEAVRALHAEKGLEVTEPFPYTLYGTTLIALAAGSSFIFALQIGDGNILMVDREGAARPVLGAESIGEDTESLCLEDAWKYIRTQIFPWNPAADAPMFLLSTDGYANSFTEQAGFLKAGADFYNLWKNEGLDLISAELPGWLRQSSDKGSGDDIALILLVHE